MRIVLRLKSTHLPAAALTITIAACTQSPDERVEIASSTKKAVEETAVVASVEPKTCATQTVASEESACQDYQQEELCQPKQFLASDGVLQTELDLQTKWQCVPTLTNNEWTVTPKLLRNYGVFYDSQFNWNFPGPTFRLKKKASATSATQGDRFKMKLTNGLGPTTVEEQMQCSDTARFTNDVVPNCFHGNETTNFHFHGFHISPQPLQDYVLLKLYPADTPGVVNYREDMTNEELKQFESIGGAYRYDLDPLPYNQPEGTHWYHAHHHGATAMQVINGMAGTFIIDGPFDKWLNDYYGYDASGQPKLQERLMVVQQINDRLATTTPLVNGQGNPLISTAPGEVQRWRFVSATTQASAQLDVYFGQLEVRQIQMDGIQFSPENYARQPLLKDNQFTLSPGNRADFLVRMPPDNKTLRFEVTQKVMGAVGQEVLDQIEVRKEAMQKIRGVSGTPTTSMPELPLMTVAMRQSQAMGMGFPRELPPLPEFLSPPNPSVRKEIAYQMYQPAASNPAPIFKIDGEQVQSCVPEKMTLTLGSDERWVVNNLWDDMPALVPDANGGNRGIAHPFHIHTNPFYVVRSGNDEYTSAADDYANGIWQDTIRLPLASDDDQDKQRASSVDLFMEFEDYTGGYVQHCHILGHEDRGMMSLVQTLCPGTDAYGTPVADHADNCELPLRPLPVCQ